LAWDFCLSFTAEEKAAMGGIALGVAGFLVGAGIDADAAKANKANGQLVSQDFSALRSLAQFPKEEPEYLNAVK
jgi:hypothetical protein